MDRVTAAKQRVVTLEGLKAQTIRTKAVVDQVRDIVLAPNSSKTPPRFNMTQLSMFTGLESSQLDNRLRRPGGGVPTGEKGGATRRYFSIGDVQEWMRHLRPEFRRPETADAAVLVSANLKGGVSKTTTAVCLAHGLSLRGHKILLIDLDPQASATSFFGLSPETHVTSEQTLYSLFQGEELSVEYAIQKTYWPGLDLIAANAGMHGADFILSARQGHEKGFEFWDVLNHGLETARGNYDIIIIDTPPSLSFTAINGLMAADGFIMPLPPKAIDFAASAQFWDLFYEMVRICKSPGRASKRFAFVDVVLSMVDSSDSATDIVREWIVGAYGEKVLPVDIPKTSAASTASKNFGSVYDLMLPGTSAERNVASSRTFKRAFDAYERLVGLIEGQVQDFWMMQTMEAAA